jgi:hypothetical protein
MRLEAILTRDDLEGLLGKFAPLEVLLGDSGRCVLTAPARVTLIPGKGMSVICDATLYWPVLRVDVPVHMRGLSVLIHPGVRPSADGKSAVLAFTLQIDRTGVSVLPGAIDDRVTSLLNVELVKKHVELSWDFGRTLSHVFALPAALASAAALSLIVSQGTIFVTDSAVVLAVDFDADVRRADGLLERRSA